MTKSSFFSLFLSTLLKTAAKIDVISKGCHPFFSNWSTTPFAPRF